MSTRDTFEQYWQSVSDEVDGLADSAVAVEALPIRSNEVSTAYGLRFKGIGDYPLFAYLSVPIGSGPFPALFEAPAYGSVVTVPAYERRKLSVVMALCHRGQRLSDSRYSASYPGLLTDGLPDASTYRWREVVADCWRALDVLMSRPEVDGARLAAAGGDLAAITAGQRPQIGSLLITGEMLFRDSAARMAAFDHYPLRELADYVRTYPDHAATASETLRLFDPLAFAPNIDAQALVTCAKSDEELAMPLVEAMGSGAGLKVRSGYGDLDHEHEERWLASRLAQ